MKLLKFIYKAVKYVLIQLGLAVGGISFGAALVVIYGFINVALGGH